MQIGPRGSPKQHRVCLIVRPTSLHLKPHLSGNSQAEERERAETLASWRIFPGSFPPLNNLFISPSWELVELFSVPLLRTAFHYRLISCKARTWTAFTLPDSNRSFGRFFTNDQAVAPGLYQLVLGFHFYSRRRRTQQIAAANSRLYVLSAVDPLYVDVTLLLSRGIMLFFLADSSPMWDV